MLDQLSPDEIAALPDNVRAAILSAQAHAKALETRIAQLEYLNAELRRAQYGKRSERFSADEQQHLFEDLETGVEEVLAATPEGANAGAQKKAPAKRNIGNLPKHLPRIEEVIEPDTIHCPHCGETGGCGAMVKIGEDRSERLDVIPAQFRVIVTVRPRYACKTCAKGVVQALAPAHLVEGGLPTEGLLAHILVSKFCDHTPLYRQAGIYARSGVDLDRTSLAKWTGVGAFHLTPIYELMARELKKSSVLHMDETPLPVLDPGKGRTRKGYLWALGRDERGFDGDDPPGVVYFYAPGRAGHYAKTFLKGFSGSLLVDGYAGYAQLGDTRRAEGALVLAHCWAHARRKLFDIFKKDSSPIAAEGLERIKALYEIEREIKGVAAENRLTVRQAKTKPLVEALHAWLLSVREKLSRKSRLAEAIAYILKHWRGLTVFLENGKVEIDNNLLENRIRPQALTRKNALFAGHDKGGQAWAKIASLIETCRINNVEPFEYLKTVLTKIAQGHPKSRLHELLPWNYPELQAQ